FCIEWDLEKVFWYVAVAIYHPDNDHQVTRRWTEEVRYGSRVQADGRHEMRSLPARRAGAGVPARPGAGALVSRDSADEGTAVVAGGYASLEGGRDPAGLPRRLYL